MANADLLMEFSQPDANQFKKDFMQFIKVGAEIDRYYGDGKNLDTYIPKYERLVEHFNNKYKGLKIATRKTIEHYKTFIFVNESSIRDFFANSASKISGLKSIGRTSFNQAEASNLEKFSQYLELLNDKVYVTYLDSSNGTSTLAAAYNHMEKKIEITFDAIDIVNANSASFKVCAFYALKNEIGKNIDIYSEASSFGFYNLLDEIEKREWVDKFKGK